MPSSASVGRRWAVELTGRNSVSPSITPSTTASTWSFTSSPDDGLAAVDADDVARDPRGVGMGQDDERTGDVLGRGETAAGVAATRLVDQRVVAGNFVRGRGRRHAGPDRVDRDAARGQLHSELTQWDSSAALAADTGPYAGSTRRPPDDVRAKMRPPSVMSPRATTSCVQYTSVCAITSTVMSI